MRQKVIISLLISFTFYFSSFTSIRADYNQAYSDYNSNYEKYRTAYRDYLQSKNAYLTYKTLSSQTDALVKTKSLLEVRDDVLISYFNVINEKLKVTPEIPDFDKNLLLVTIQNRISILLNHKSSIAAVSSLDDLVNKSREIDSVKDNIRFEAEQEIGNILIGKVKSQSAKVTDTITAETDFVNRIKTTGKDTSKLERWLLETNYKHDLAETKLQDAKGMFSALTSSDDIYKKKDYFANGKATVLEGNQYLKESVFNALEAIKEIMAGPY